MSKTYEIHPIAAVLPEMNANEYADLKEDIRKRGCIVPVVIYEGKLLDGRHRYRACKELGVEFYENYYDEGDPAGYVLALNVNRRNLTVSQRATVAAELANMKRGGDRKSDQSSSTTTLISKSAAAKAVGVSEESVTNARAVIARAKPEVVEAVKSGEMTLNAAVKTLAPKPVKQPEKTEFDKACDLVEQKIGKVHADALRDKLLVVPDLEYFASLPAERMKQLEELVMVNRWSAKRAERFLDDTLDENSRIVDLKHRCNAAGGQFECNIGGFKITVVNETTLIRNAMK